MLLSNMHSIITRIYSALVSALFVLYNLPVLWNACAVSCIYLVNLNQNTVQIILEFRLMNQNTLHTTKHYSCMHVWFVFVKCRLISKTSNNTGSLRTLY